MVLSAILDPKTNLPNNLVNFAVKQLVGVLVYLLQEAARKVRFITLGRQTRGGEGRQEQTFLYHKSLFSMPFLSHLVNALPPLTPSSLSVALV